MPQMELQLAMLSRHAAWPLLNGRGVTGRSPSLQSWGSKNTQCIVYQPVQADIGKT